MCGVLFSPVKVLVLICSCCWFCVFFFRSCNCSSMYSGGTAISLYLICLNATNQFAMLVCVPQVTVVVFAVHWTDCSHCCMSTTLFRMPSSSGNANLSGSGAAARWGGKATAGFGRGSPAVSRKSPMSFITPSASTCVFCCPV